MTDDEIKALVDALPWAEWSKDKFGPGYTVLYRDLVVKTGNATAKALGTTWKQADPFTAEFMTKYVGERITQLEGTSKELVTKTVRRVLDEAKGLPAPELGSLIRESVADQFDDFAKWRADRIARTEPAIAFNHGTLLGIQQVNGEDAEVEVFDNEDCEICAPAVASSPWSIAEALAEPIGHPNCERAFAPARP